MSFLYDVCLVGVEVLPVQFGREVYDLGDVVYAPLGELGGDVLAAIARADDAQLAGVIARVSETAATSPPAAEELLRAMQDGASDLWRLAVRGVEEPDMFVGRELVRLQALYHEALPQRFAAPRLARVKLYVCASHPDVGRFRVDAGLGVRWLLWSSESHPLHRYFPDPGDDESACHVILRIDATQRRMDEEERGDLPEDSYQCDCALWLPPHLAGDLEARRDWESP